MFYNNIPWLFTFDYVAQTCEGVGAELYAEEINMPVLVGMLLARVDICHCYVHDLLVAHVFEELDKHRVDVGLECWLEQEAELVVDVVYVTVAVDDTEELIFSSVFKYMPNAPIRVPEI